MARYESQGASSGQLEQRKRVGRLDTPLGENVLVVARLDATEGLSELSEYRVEALSERPNIDFNELLGKNCTVTIESFGKKRLFDGLVVEAQAVGVRETLFVYRLVLRPALWLLARRAKSKIYKQKSVPDIIKEVTKEYGIGIEEKLTKSYSALEYCVQYRETDLAFVCRLMELYGIYYYFRHEPKNHKVVLADAKSSHESGPTIDYNPDMIATHAGEEVITHLTSERRIRSGKVELKAYDYTKVNPVVGTKNAAESYNHSKLELSDYQFRSWDHKNTSAYSDFATARLEAEQALDHRRHFTGSAGSLCPGNKFNLSRHPHESGEYLVVRCSHTFVTEHYRSGASAISDQAYYGNYEVLKADQQFRAPIVTPKALVDGPQTAEVTGSGEIDVDELGRIQVKFFWEGQEISRRVRVAQLWSANKWGSQFIPRVGMEVLVIFEEGDPDHPLVIGTVYNGKNKYPYDLPGNKTQSGLKSNSSPGGNGYNEFMFEDKKGGEIIRMHAEKDHEVTILNKETTTIGERFMPPKGSASREHTLKNGDDNLTIQMGDQNLKISLGDQNVTISVGSQKTFVMQTISTTSMISNTTTVAPSTIAISPASISVTSPVINLTGMATINLTAPIINITGVVNLTGMLNITGGVLVNGMVPMLIPA